jgi:hypothetical protein
MCFILSTERNKIIYDYLLKILYKCSYTEFKIFFKKLKKFINFCDCIPYKKFYIEKIYHSSRQQDKIDTPRSLLLSSIEKGTGFYPPGLGLEGPCLSAL